MLGQDGGVVDDRAMLGMVDDLVGDELTAERHHVQVGFDGAVLLQHLGITELAIRPSHWLLSMQNSRMADQILIKSRST